MGDVLGIVQGLTGLSGMIAALMNACEFEYMSNENQLVLGDPHNDTGQQVMSGAQACCSCGGGTNAGRQEAHITDALQDIYISTNGSNWGHWDPVLWPAELWDSSAHYCRWEYVRCDHEAHLVSIAFFDNRGTGTIPPSIANITTLRVFLSVLNKLSGTLPDSMQQMTELKALAPIGLGDMFGFRSISGGSD